MFSTLQRPTSEEIERRRALRGNVGGSQYFNEFPRSSTLQRKDSMISRGFNAIFRKDSFMAKNSSKSPGRRKMLPATPTGGSSGNFVNLINNNNSAENPPPLPMRHVNPLMADFLNNNHLGNSAEYPPHEPKIPRPTGRRLSRRVEFHF